MNNEFFKTGNITSLIGQGIGDTTSVLGHMYQNILKPIANIVGNIGVQILE